MFKSQKGLIIEHLREMDECSDSDRDGSWNDGIEVGISDAFKSFAERVEFYKKYRSHVIISDTEGMYFFKKEQPKIYKAFKKYVKKNNKYYDGFICDIYNNWLFTYCFGDV